MPQISIFPAMVLAPYSTEHRQTQLLLLSVCILNSDFQTTLCMYVQRSYFKAVL